MSPFLTNILSTNITNYVPLCGPCLLLTIKEQKIKEILNLREEVRGKRQRKKKELEREIKDLFFYCL